jgi:hypothetical protein
VRTVALLRQVRRGQFSPLGDVTSIPCEIESRVVISSKTILQTSFLVLLISPSGSRSGRQNVNPERLPRTFPGLQNVTYYFKRGRKERPFVGSYAEFAYS